MSMVSDRPVAPPRRGVRGDLIAGALAIGLVVAASAVGFALDVRLAGDPHFPGAPKTFGEWPVLGEWLPHLGPGTPLAILIALAAVGWGPALCLRLPWRGALAGGYLLAVSWTLALSLVDGWRRGVADRLTTRDEYVHAVPGITDIPAMVRTFTDRIVDGRPDSWTTHVAGHPPGATLVFVWLDRIGLSGGAWAGIVCILVAGAAAVAVPVTIAALGREDLARAALPFSALLPGAVWLGVSADGLFAGLTATAVALLALGARHLPPRPESRLRPTVHPESLLQPPALPESRLRPLDHPESPLQPLGWGEGRLQPRTHPESPLQASAQAEGRLRVPAQPEGGFRPGAVRRGVGVGLCLAGGVLLGFGIFLSYGLVLMAPIALAVVWIARSWRALALAVLGALGVVAGFALAGFWWLDGYHLVLERYQQSVAQVRPYAYWVWADLGCLVLATGPAAAAGLRRAARDRSPLAILAGAAALAVLAATMSGLSKAEVERIWLPFAVWLVAAAALLPAATSRGWLAAGAGTALVVNHLLLTNW